MYLPLILFFISLAGISTLLYRRVIILERSGVAVREIDGEFFFDVPDLHEVQYVIVKKIKQYGYVALVLTIRVYIRSSKIMDSLYKEAMNSISAVYKKYIQKKNPESKPKEVSKFLKMVSEYKHKIAEIKERVKEEEGFR